MQQFSRIPLDVWVALAVGVGLWAAASEDVTLILAGLYAMLSAYVAVRTFTES